MDDKEFEELKRDLQVTIEKLNRLQDEYRAETGRNYVYLGPCSGKRMKAFKPWNKKGEFRRRREDNGL